MFCVFLLFNAFFGIINLKFNQLYSKEMVKKQKNLNKGSMVIYKPEGGNIKLEIKLEKDTIWLDARQIAHIFSVNRPAIVKHINNIYKTEELNKKSTCSILEQVAADGKKRKVNLYNLDMVISVGYRVNSKQATRFRIWATKILKDYLTKGYSINRSALSVSENKFKKLQETIEFLRKKSRAKILDGQEKGIIDLLADYSNALSLLEKYDKKEIEKTKEAKGRFVLKYQESKKIIENIKSNLQSKNEASDIFGREIESRLEAVISNLYQTYGKEELYSSLEEKSAHLLYLIIKDHPFSDGNKRIASFLFIYFLDRNNYLHKRTGEKKINDNALTTLALLVAESNPKEKQQIIALITQLLK